ncbi:hypothetical protein [Ferrovibrio sp.]|uniref:hypothetical protein n=1 Tax=Ferrovibrio sp. TaxID=1917215 RepID=UPI0025BD6180|nr:hypothetical protein [Ferrovibrio sp.]
MALKFETFSNQDARNGWRPGNNFGGHSLFKALGHPKTMAQGRALAASLSGYGRLVVYDPEPAPAAEHFDAFFPIPRANLAAVLVQRVEDLGQERLGLPTRPVTDLKALAPDGLLIAAFDADTLAKQIERLLPPGCKVHTLDEMRLPDSWLSNRARYLDPNNFATNFAFLRDTAGIAETGGDGLHTKLVTANYWKGYGAEAPALWCCLFGSDGAVLAEWTEDKLGEAFHTIVIDSREVRQRFGLEDFAGSLFLHALRVKGHDVVKYALDSFSDSGRQLSCTHDANAWPADLYAGVPAPRPGEKLMLWVQNSHPLTIPAGAIGANLMGGQAISYYDAEVPPFGTVAVDLGALLPEARFPDQIEIQAGRYFVRPRYEIVQADQPGQPGQPGRRRIAHANVERIDLKPDPRLPQLGGLIGKGYIMPLPVLPLERWRSVTLPTPMSTAQAELPLRAVLVDASGEMVAEEYLGRLARRESRPSDIDAWLAAAGGELKSGYGHVEYLYDFREGGEADGWLHALGLYEQRASGHQAETIFGAHIYNMPITYRDEPQSYTHRPPGLTTRLFLRLGDAPFDSICHLLYPASLPAESYGPGQSQTMLTLFDAQYRRVAERPIAIPQGGSYFFRVSELFGEAARAEAGSGGWVQVRDITCRLFGFHGLEMGEQSFCLDHMFGF